KVNYSPVLLSAVEGNGKDALFEPLREALGRDNVATISPGNIVAPFNSAWVEKQFVIINEVRTFQRQEFMDALKPYITNMPDALDVRKKNCPEYYIPNIMNVVMFTNRSDALAPTVHDRRLWIHDCSHAPAFGDDERTRLFGYYEAGNGFAHVFAY